MTSNKYPKMKGAESPYHIIGKRPNFPNFITESGEKSFLIYNLINGECLDIQNHRINGDFKHFLCTDWERFDTMLESMKSSMIRQDPNICIPAYRYQGFDGDTAFISTLNEPGRPFTWGNVILKDGSKLLRMIVSVKNQDTQIWDFYDLRSKFFEIPIEAQEVIFKNVNGNESLCRNIISFLSPCVSESSYIWANYSNREDLDTPTHVYTQPEFERRLISYAKHMDKSLREKMLAQNILGVKDDLKEDMRCQLLLSLRILKFKDSKISFPLRTTDVRLSDLKPCYGIAYYLHMCAEKFNIPIEARVINIMKRFCSPVSRTMVKSCVRRGQLNLLIYANNYYRKENGYRSVCTRIQKFPKYDHILQECIEMDNVLPRYDVQRYHNVIDLDDFFIMYDHFTLESTMINRGILPNEEGFDYMKKFFNDKIRTDRADPEIFIKESNIMKSMFDQRSFIRSSTIIVFEDGTRIRASHCTTRKFRSMLNKTMCKQNEEAAKAIKMVEECRSDKRFIASYKKRFGHRLDGEFWNMRAKFEPLNRLVEMENKLWEDNRFYRELELQELQHQQLLEERTAAAQATWIQMEEEEGDY